MKAAIFALLGAAAIYAGQMSTADAKAYVLKRWEGLPWVSVRQLVAAQANGDEFDRQYKNKRIVIYGYIDHVRVANGKAFVWFKPDKLPHASGMVDATMSPELAANLPANLYIAYDCVILGRVLGNISAGDCHTSGLPAWKPK